jgi:hypothetical protein
VLGANLFAGTRLELDIAQRRLRIDASQRRAPLAHPVPVELRFGVFVLAPVTIQGVSATAQIDTGARRSVANNLLRRALGFADGDARLTASGLDGGATNQPMQGVTADVTGLVLGGEDLGARNLAFADLPVFAALGLAEGPAIIIGDDVLSGLSTLAIDYSNAQLMITR